MLFHAGNDLFHDALLAADLGARDEPAEVIHVQQRADVQQAAEDAGHLRDAAALDIERQVRGEEPVVQLQLVRLGPVAHAVDGHALVAQVRQAVHQQAVARGRAERVNDVDLPVGIALADDARGVFRRVRHAGQARGQADMQNVLALLEKRGEIVHELRNVHLRGARLGAVCHGGVKLVKRHRLAQIVRVIHAVERIVEADIRNVTLLEMLLGQVGGGAAAQYEIGHFVGLLCILRFARRAGRCDSFST